MDKIQGIKHESGLLMYAKAVRGYCTRLKWDIINKEYRQAIRSGGAVIANYTEAPDDLGKADEKKSLNRQAGSQGNNQMVGPAADL